MKSIANKDSIKLLEKLEESKRRLYAIILQVPASVTILRGKNHIIEMVNSHSLEIWGRKEADILNKPILDAMPELITQGIKEMLESVYKTGKVFSVSELPVNVRRGGKEEEIYLNVSYEPLYHAAGEIDGIIAVAIEVTEQVTARKKIKESEERFRVLADNIPNLAWMAHADGWIYWYNKKWYDYTGTAPEQMEGWGWQSVHEEKALPEVLVKWHNSIKLGKKFEMVFPLKGADGEFRHFLTRVLPIHDEQGKITQWLGTNTDITEQIEAQKKMEASEEFNRTVLESSPDCLKIIDTEGRLQYMNFNGLCQMEIDDFSQFKSKHWWHLWGTENEQKVKEAITRALSGETAQFMAFCPTAKGNPKWWDVVVSPIGKSGEPVHQIISVSRDITAQKNVDLKISESEKKFKLLADSMPQHVWTADSQGNLNYYNKSVFNYSGLTPKQIAKDGWIQIVHPADRGATSKAWKESVTNGNQFSCEHRLRRHDGEYRWQLSRAIPQKDENGDIQMWVGTGTDIQEQKDFRYELEKQVKHRTAELIQLNESFKKSEERYHLMVEEVQDYAILYLNREGFVQNWNAGAEKIKGYKAEEIIGKNFSNFYTEEDRENNLPHKLLELAVRTGKAVQEGWRVKKDRTLFWASVVITAVHNQNREVIGFSKVTHDLTDKKTAEDKLKKSEERYHLMVEEVEDYAILYLNLEGTVENWNAGAEKIKGYTAEEIIGKSFSNFYTAEDRAANLPQRLLQLAKRTGRAKQEGWRVKKGGTLFWASVVITAVHNEKREVIGFSKVTHDLTDKKNAEDELYRNKLEVEQMNSNLQKMNKELQAFAFISSHDLQEPLRKIQTFASRIAEKEVNNLSDAGKDLFRRMKSSAERMQALIEDLLAYSRIQTPQRNFEKVSIDALVAQVTLDLKEEIEDKHATVAIMGTCEVNIILFQFRQLFYNLISNSLKFSNTENQLLITISTEFAKGGKLKEASLDKNTNYCHISVSDNGIGFEPQYRERIFELFQRLHGKDEYRGTGIGLAIVKRIVENHNGIITANGELDKGARFDIYLPVDTD